MTNTADVAARLAALVAHVREGWSIVRACRVLHVSQKTVWLRRRSDPEFAAALHEAEQLAADVRAQERADDLREQLAAHSLELADREREDAPSKRNGTRRQRHLLAKLHGTSPALFPGRSPSDMRESEDRLERMGQRITRARMSEAFAKRRAEKRGNTAEPTPSEPAGKAPYSQAEPTPSGPPRRKGIARVLW